MFFKILVGIVTITGVVTPNLVEAQVIIQSGSSSANAEGENNWAVGGVEQSAKQSNNLSNYGNSHRIIQQSGRVNSSARGRNNTVVGNINQSAQQEKNNQTAIQNASGNYRVTGSNNVVNGKINQISNQGQ
jgi:hypothetical protein